MRDEPGDGRAAHVRLKIVALHGNEAAAQGVRAGDPGLPLQGERPRGGSRGARDVGPLVRGQGGEEVDQGERVVQVAQRVRQGGVPLSHQVVQAVGGAGGRQSFRGGRVAFRARTPHPPLQGDVRPELGQQGLVRQEADILGVVVRAVAAVRFFTRLARVDALEDAEAAGKREEGRREGRVSKGQGRRRRRLGRSSRSAALSSPFASLHSPKLGQLQLQLLQRLVAGQVGRRIAGLALLLCGGRERGERHQRPCFFFFRRPTPAVGGCEPMRSDPSTPPALSRRTRRRILPMVRYVELLCVSRQEGESGPRAGEGGGGRESELSLG